jgi:hypothetical protein
MGEFFLKLKSPKILNVGQKEAFGGGRNSRKEGTAPLWLTLSPSNLANCLASMDQLPSAEWHYQQAIALDPTFADAHSNYGNLLPRAVPGLKF